MRSVLITLILCVTLLAGLWMWLGEWQYAGIAPLTRTNRLTGETQGFDTFSNTWVKVQAPQ